MRTRLYITYADKAITCTEMAASNARCVCLQPFCGHIRISPRHCLCGRSDRSRKLQWFYYVRKRQHPTASERRVDSSLPTCIETIEALCAELRSADFKAGFTTGGTRVLGRLPPVDGGALETVVSRWVGVTPSERRVEAEVVRKA